jgi:hypothetical protein
VVTGDALLTLHAAAPGELAYALAYAGSAETIVALEREP